MAAINFPDAPEVNDLFTAAGTTWKWDGVTWTVQRVGLQGTQGTQGVQGETGTQGAEGAQGVQGTEGAQGTQGTQGAVGPGVAAEGLEGQVLVKLSDTSYDTTWIDNYANEVRLICKNDSGSVAIPKGTVVMATGSAGDTIEVAPAVSDGTVNAEFFLGVTSELIAADGTGYVTLLGPIKGINTNAYPIGTVLYIDPNTPGGFTSTQPTAPDIDLSIAIVTKQSTNNGRIFVRMWSQGQKLSELYDIDLTGVQDGYALTYNSAQGLWRATQEVGPQGAQGVEGAQGIQGSAGTQGAEGTQGTQGTDGVQGLDGANGAQGTQGTEGAQGVQGTQGAQGEGIQGAQGTAGIPPTGTATIPDVLMLGGM